MSYSFFVTGASKAAVKAKVVEQFDIVAQQQPSHSADKDAAISATSTFVDLLTDVPDGHEIHVSVHGSLGWNHHTPDKFTSASVGVSAHFTKVEATSNG